VVSELVIDVQSNDVSIAVLEDKKLAEFQKEARNISFSVGDIYLGKIKKLMPGLNAAFVDVGYKKDAFLHYQDLGIDFNSLNKFLETAVSDKKKLPAIGKFIHLPSLPKEGSITDVLKYGDSVLVQIVKEPISTKGPRLSCEISFAGRYLVIIPFGDKVNVSQKIKSTEERVRLKQLIQSIKPKNFAVIVRTSAEGKRVVELDTELKTLVKRWDDNMTKLLKNKAPSLIYEETGRTVALLRDIFSPSFEHIYINDTEVYNDVHDYVSLIAPDRVKIIELYKGELPIFDNYQVTRQLKTGFGKTVTFKKGAYLIIEHTEAMHVIDVNSGNRSKSNSGQEMTAREVNLAAADEIARQFRLRDMGGIIVIDFIDMQESENRQKLFDHMRTIMANDRAKHNI
jgi:ribonuclease G